MLVVALIPARGGSKGIPRKNLRTVAGKPLLAYSIAAAVDSDLVDRTFVSTEDEEIAAVARSFGAEVITRPPALATDTAQNDAVCIHALDAMRQSGLSPEILVLLQPTSPLRTALNIDDCLAGLRASGANSAMSICPVSHHPAKCVVRSGDLVSPYINEMEFEARRQDLPVLFRQNGAIYAVRVEAFLARRRFYCPPCHGYVMGSDVSIDVDQEVDIALADLILAGKIAERSDQ